MSFYAGFFFLLRRNRKPGTATNLTPKNRSKKKSKTTRKRTSSEHFFARFFTVFEHKKDCFLHAFYAFLVVSGAVRRASTSARVALAAVRRSS